MSFNPYALPVLAQGDSQMSAARRLMEPFIADHMKGFGEAMEGHLGDDTKKMAARARGHALMRVGLAAAHQAKHVAHATIERNPFTRPAHEASLASGTLNANITAFITQMIHMTLDVYPRLMAPYLVSVQPFTQPSGYIFHLSRVAKNNGAGGTGADRNLATKSTFDKTYGDLAAEGDQLKAVGVTLEKTLVEVRYKGLMHQHSHQVDVALRSQYGLDIGSLGDMITADELAWEVDRDVVDAVVTFANTNALGTIYFDPTAGGTYSAMVPSEQREYDKGFITKAMSRADIEMSADIYRTANWAIAGTNVILHLAKTPEVYASTAGNMMDTQVNRGGIITVGVTKDGKTIYHDPQLDTNVMIVGYIDNMNPFYAGYVYSPFGLASVLTAAFQDPDTLLTRKARALAYAKVGVNARQFRRIKLGTTS